MSRSEYYYSLNVEMRRQYDQKIVIIDNLDPYCLGISSTSPVNISIDLTTIPVVCFMDLVNYLVLTHNAFTGKQFKAYKSLEAYKYYEAGFVREVLAGKVNADAYIVMGKVGHSEGILEEPLHVWIILLGDGAVSCAHCTCMTGLGEACSHIAALLFYLEAGPTKSDAVPCTETLSQWPISAVKTVKNIRVRDMNLATKPMRISQSDISVPPLEGQNLIAMLENFERLNFIPAICAVLEPFATKMATCAPPSQLEHLE